MADEYKIEDISPEDVAEKKYLKKAGAAYDKAMPEADTTFGKLKGKSAFQNKFQYPESAQSPKSKFISPKEDKFTYDDTEGGASLMYRKPYTKPMKAGGKVSASSRADGIAQRGKTKGTMVMCGGGKT
jgi:hypothetical protein